MQRKLTFRAWPLWMAGGILVAALAGCTPQQSVSAAGAVAAQVPPSGARIWFYRDYEPSVSQNLAGVLLNGSLAGYAPADGSVFYRDVAPGQYHITAASYGVDVNQDRTIDLAAGQEAFVKILDTDAWTSTGGDTTAFRRDTFYVSLVPPQIAKGEISGRSLISG
jgi:hypothetical protein